MKEFFLILTIFVILFICFALYCCLVMGAKEDRRINLPVENDINKDSEQNKNL